MQITAKQTDLVVRLGLTGPVIQAPIAGDATTPELIAAVSNAAHWARSAEPIKETLESSAWAEFCLQRNYLN